LETHYALFPSPEMNLLPAAEVVDCGQNLVCYVARVRSYNACTLAAPDKANCGQFHRKLVLLSLPPLEINLVPRRRRSRLWSAIWQVFAMHTMAARYVANCVIHGVHSQDPEPSPRLLCCFRHLPTNRILLEATVLSVLDMHAHWLHPVRQIAYTREALDTTHAC
jgi:hypothetical protein